MKKMLITQPRTLTMLHRLLNCLEKGLNEEAKSLLQTLGNFCALKDTSGSTFVHYSVKHGNPEMTQYVIDEGCNINVQDNSGVTPLMLAVKASDVRITELLLESKADIYIADSNGTNSLEQAFYLRLQSPRPSQLKYNLHIILEMLFDRVNNDFKAGKLRHLLLNVNDSLKLAFVVFGNVEVTRFMLKNGYSVDFDVSQWGYTALHCAIILARFESAKTLIEHGANINALDNDEYSPLYHYGRSFEAVDQESEVLKCLLRNSTTLSTPDECGFTDVEGLLFSRNKKTIKAVFLSGIDLHACLNNDKFLLQLLVNNDNPDVLDLFDELDIKFDVNQCNASDRSTALMEAALHGCPKKVEFLLRHGADVNLTDVSGLSALAHTRISDGVTGSNVAKVIELLLQHGADAQSFYRDRPALIGNFSLGTRVIVAHLAILGALEHPTLNYFSRSAIESNSQLKTYFDLCTQQLEEMKQCEVHGTVTVFKLLSEREEKIVVYARNPQFKSGVNRAMKNLSHVEKYYLNTLQRRISNGLDVAKMQEKVALIIDSLTGLCADVHHAIVYKVISYLDRQSLCNLCEIEGPLRCG